MLAGKVDHTNLSREFSGVVVEVGDNVTSVQVGDSVCGICVNGASTYQSVPEGLCQKIDAHTQEVFTLTSMFLCFTMNRTLAHNL